MQPPYSLFRREIETEILLLPGRRHRSVRIWPTHHRLLGGSCTPQTTFAPNDWRSQHESFHGENFARNVAVVEGLKHLAARQRMSIAQLAITWVLAQPAIDVAIVGARNPEQLTQTAVVSEKHLTPETLQEIKSVMRTAVPIRRIGS
ncbi:aldo/keto reductase [Ktedonobacter sp. SOSP1-52]|uniref:aldo/keto reductase n=1 Tax=Ktedonobacter sp. SOSP1-52 TaxID=2778366 RepID=UPI001916B316|nr:aldo/keto reductase [Ktedonobacter sp. SOSP1-52]